MTKQETPSTQQENKPLKSEERKAWHQPQLKKASITEDTLLGFSTYSDGLGSS